MAIQRINLPGEYKGKNEDVNISLTLRIDLGENNSLNVISGDVFVLSTPEDKFAHSFVSTAVVNEDSSHTLRCPLKVFDNKITQARLDLDIPNTGDLTARYNFRMGPSLYELKIQLEKTSNFFRKVELEVDRLTNIPLPQPFSKPTLPTGSPSDAMTMESVYGDAGVELVVSQNDDDISISGAGSDKRWSDEELHSAMVNNFSKHKDSPQWHLYLFLANLYVKPGVLGIMFDDDDFPRQGAAVFYNHPSIANASGSERNREYLYTIIHELGHAFNLLHSFQKGFFQTHGVLPKPDSLSWMNYPQLYPFGNSKPSGWDGTDQFWSKFNFHFDQQELFHIRHHDYKEIAMGGTQFGGHGHLEERNFERPTSYNGISLELSTPKHLEFLQQLEGSVFLSNQGEKPTKVHTNLHLSTGTIDLLVRRPYDSFPKVYRNFYQVCVKEEFSILEPQQTKYQEITPSFGSRSWLFDEPGTYEVQATYKSPEGYHLVSNIQKVRILRPTPEADRLAADFFTANTGTYFGVEGSRCDSMTSTRDMLANMTNQLKGSKIEKQIRVVNALRETRDFKSVVTGKVYSENKTDTAKELNEALQACMKKDQVSIDTGFCVMRATRALRKTASFYLSEKQADKAQNIIKIINGLYKNSYVPSQIREEVQFLEKQIKK